MMILTAQITMARSVSFADPVDAFVRKADPYLVTVSQMEAVHVIICVKKNATQ
jgi:hypothetical protein